MTRKDRVSSGNLAVPIACNLEERKELEFDFSKSKTWDTRKSVKTFKQEFEFHKLTASQLFSHQLVILRVSQ